ncbi:response regulator transcription factor [Vibrio maerlii]|uniref:response regulator transcription factor n=1 Tax=Vibrio maerlii TaxID=2231648 RepID=UPI000E3BFCC5|nr:response regulator transcription factor [Vibrio maerlii]
MQPRQITLLAPEGLQRCLIEKQLSIINNTSITSCSTHQLIVNTNSRKPDLVVLDYHYLVQLQEGSTLPDFDLLDLNILIHNVPKTGEDYSFMRWESLKGMLFETASIDHLTESVMYILNGGLWLPRQCLESMINYYRTPSVLRTGEVDALTKRERQILELLGRDYSNQKIADQLFLAESTVKTHIFKLYKKLHVHKREDAVKALKLMRK